MINKNQRKILIRGIISGSIIAIYLFGSKQLVQPDPKGLGFSFMILAAAVFSLIVGVVLTLVVLLRKKQWANSLLFILTAMSNTLMLIICTTMNNDNMLLHVLCYAGIITGIVQLFLILKSYRSKKSFIFEHR